MIVVDGSINIANAVGDDGAALRNDRDLANRELVDAAYIGLTEALGCALLTADARFATAPGPRCEIQILGY